MKITTKPVFAYPQGKPPIFRTFMREDRAMFWLSAVMGGLGFDGQEGIYADFKNEGWSSLTDPTGQRFVACMHWN